MMELLGCFKDLPDSSPQIQGIPFSGGIVGFSSYDMVIILRFAGRGGKDGLLNPLIVHI